MKKNLKNIKMLEMLNQLQPILERRDMLGYVAARNTRILSEALTEYETFRYGLFEKYGKRVPDDKGVPQWTIPIGTEEYRKFNEELAPFNEISHDVELMTAKYSDAIGSLSGEEILKVDWMLED